VASTHDAVNVPAQPDAPLTCNASNRRLLDTALELPLAPTVSDTAGDTTAMPAGRDASAWSNVAHTLTLMAREQLAVSREYTRSVGAGISASPGSALSAVSADVDSHDTVKVTG